MVKSTEEKVKGRVTAVTRPEARHTGARPNKLLRNTNSPPRKVSNAYGTASALSPARTAERGFGRVADGAGAPMSVEAISWALNLAPVPVDPSGKPNSACAAVLVGLANHADPDGTNAFPSVRTLMRYTRLSERTVRTCLDRLEAAATIGPCDPAIIAAKIRRADRRPKGWDLDTTLIRDDLTDEDIESLERIYPGLRARIDAKRGASVAPREVNGVQLTQERGATDAERGATVAPEPSIEPSIEPKDGSPLRDDAGDGLFPDSRPARPAKQPPAKQPPAKQPPAKLSPDPATTQAQAIAKAAYDATGGLVKFPAVMAIAKQALKAGHDPDVVEAAVLTLIEETRPITVETLRVQLARDGSRAGEQAAPPVADFYPVHPPCGRRHSDFAYCAAER